MLIGLDVEPTKLLGSGWAFYIFTPLKPNIGNASKEYLETFAVGKWTLAFRSVSDNATEADDDRDNGPHRQTMRQYLGDVKRTIGISDRFQNDIGKWKVEISLFRNNTGFALENRGRRRDDIRPTPVRYQHAELLLVGKYRS